MAKGRWIAALILVFPLVVRSQDWPQWRGPNRDGTVAGFVEPGTWPDQLKKVWQANVGLGHSSPLLVKGRIYLLTRLGEQEVVSCLDLGAGKQIWRDSYAAPYAVNPAATRHGKGPKSTPVYASGKLFTLGISGIFSCYDAEKGKLLWRREFGSEFKTTSPYYGTATSPLVDGRIVVAYVGGHDSGALTAFDVETGKTVWSWNGDGPAYTSPIVADLGGTRQIVTQSQKNIIGVSLADGKALWSIPFTTPYVQNIITPVLFKDTLIFSGLDQAVMAIKVARQGGEWKTEKVWENPGASFYMSTPVLNGNVLFGMSQKSRGQFVALDAATGRTLWMTDGREGEGAAVLSAGNKVFFLTNEATLVVARASGGSFEQIRRYTVAQSPTWAHPLLSGKSIVVKDAEALTLWRFE